MKKIILFLFLLFLLENPSCALSYKFNLEAMKYQIDPPISQNDEKIHKNLVKASSADKVNKKINYYEKILKIDPNFVPAIYELTFLHAEKNSVSEVLKYALKLRELNADCPQDMVTDVIARSYFSLDNYNDAVFEFEKIKDSNIYKRNYLILAEAFYKLENYDKSIYYASKVPIQDSNYYRANELLYFSYFFMNNKLSALKHGKILIKLNPNDYNNYLKSAEVCDNKIDKLKFLYKAKKLILQNPDKNLFYVDDMIAQIEQEKIDKAHSQLIDFVVKPDWKKIYKNNTSDLNFYVTNWSNRQDEFFKTANNCVAKYYNQNLIKCFEALNNSEEKITEELNAKIKELKEIERQKRQEFIMQDMVDTQRQIWYGMNYYHSPYRLRRPYYW